MISAAGPDGEDAELGVPVLQLKVINIKAGEVGAEELAARRDPDASATFASTAPCRLCLGPFARGEVLVLSYLDPDSTPRWVHLDCVRAVLRLRGREL